MPEFRLPRLIDGQQWALRARMMAAVSSAPSAGQEPAAVQSVIDPNAVHRELAAGGRSRGVYVDWSDVRFTSIATPAPLALFQELAEKVRDAAKSVGFPEPQPAKARVSFDKVALQILGDELAGAPLGQLWLDATWQVFSFLLLPDVTHWRFPDNLGSSDLARWGSAWRLLYRHVFGRLWLRDWTLGRDLALTLGEDQAHSVFERPALTASREVARAMCSGVVDAAKKQADQDVFRCVGANLYRIGAAKVLDALAPDAVRDISAEFAREHWRLGKKCPCKSK